MLAAGIIVQIKGDPMPGRRYHLTGEAYGNGWWAFPVDGAPVAPEVQRLSNSAQAAWVPADEVIPDGPEMVSAPLGVLRQATPEAHAALFA